jgi:small subunit ribosomal protein S20
MPHSVSAAKRARQSEKLRIYNKNIKTRIRSLIKKLRGMVEAGKIDEAKTVYVAVTKRLDHAAAKGVFHKNTVSRYKSRLALMINKAAKT